MARVLPRSHSRAAAVQALYQALVHDQTPEKAALDFITAENSDKMDIKYFNGLVAGVSQEVEALNAELDFAIDRNIAEIDPVESSVLRLAIFELIHRPQIPYRVVLNEAIELAKAFGGEQGHKYVNGVLDKLGARLRAVEYQAANKKSKK